MQNNVKQNNPFLYLIYVLIKYRKGIIGLVFISCFSGLLFAILSPKWYKSTATVFPVEQTDFLSSMSGLSSIFKSISPAKGLAGLTGNDETDKYIAILNSSTMLDSVVKKFDLITVYDLKDDYYENVIKELLSNIDIEVEDEGQLTVSVLDTNKFRAAEIANFMVDYLNEINSKLLSMNSKANREFIEKRVILNKKDIDSLELSMEVFQKQYGVIAVPEQIEASIKSMSELYAKLAEKEIEVKVLEKTISSDNPALSVARTEIDELHSQILKINSGNWDMTSDLNIIIPMKKAPELAKEYIKLYRDLEIQYTILEFITPMYEQAKVEEQRNTPSVIVLDKAGPAERKAKPRISIYLMISFVVSLSVALFYAFTREYIKILKENNEDYFVLIKDMMKKK